MVGDYFGRHFFEFIEVHFSCGSSSDAETGSGSHGLLRSENLEALKNSQPPTPSPVPHLLGGENGNDRN